jgi:hypothetical protein
MRTENVEVDGWHGLWLLEENDTLGHGLAVFVRIQSWRDKCRQG